MKKNLFLILFLTIVTIVSKVNSAYADDANWKIYPIFDEEVSHVVETPNYIYFTSGNLIQNNEQESFFSLFRFDRKGEELLALSTDNLLSANNIRDIIYNPQKSYVAVLYKDYEIDLLHNDGKVSRIPYYHQSDPGTDKSVYSITIDPDHDRFYLATDFGYVAINDKKEEIAESRIYGEPFKAFARLGDKYMAIQENNLIWADASVPRLSLEDYQRIGEFEDPHALYPLGDDLCLLMIGAKDSPTVKLITLKGSEFEIDDLWTGRVYNVEYVPSGIVIGSSDSLVQVSNEGKLNSIERHANFRNSAAVSSDMAQVWNGLMRKGLSCVKKTGDQWNLVYDWMRPNAPAVLGSLSYANHPDKGLLIANLGFSGATINDYSFSPMQLDGYKQGRWTHYAPAYTNSKRTNILRSTTGLAVDPDNRQYVYVTSYHNGVARFNLNDPEDIIHLARAADADSANPGFQVLKPTPNLNPGYSNISQPFFDKQGNLWMSFANWDDKEEPNPHFYCWLAEDRKASTPTDVKGPKHVEFQVEMSPTNYLFSLPLLHTGNGLIAHSAGLPHDEIVLIDTNGTPTDTSDDNYYKFMSYTDSDGNTIVPGRINYMWEDPSSGYVWVCHADGVFYFVPSQVRNGNYQVYRVKVSRNDGTNLADYLLDGVFVTYLTADSEGRKWFSTSGGGLVCTSSDGREILNEFNTENCPIPDDVVYSVGYNSASNSLMVATPLGWAEYSLPVSQASSTKEDIRAYPNPVRPEYSGYVTITDIPTGSFVKIADSAGNLVKELGIVSGFDILWDLSDSKFNRVRSGVYHILVSPSNENSSYSTVGKILVIS